MTIEQIQSVALLFKNDPTLKVEQVELGLIFGEYAENEHFLRNQIADIKKTTLDLMGYIEPVIEAPVVEQEPLPPLEDIISQII